MDFCKCIVYKNPCANARVLIIPLIIIFRKIGYKAVNIFKYSLNIS